MAYPDLYSDETVVLKAQNIKVKSVSFEAVLTTRRLILVDSKKHLIAPQEILLATIRDIEPGENAIRDPTITLSIITPTGSTRQMILTFSKMSGGERKRECDEWIKVIHQVIEASMRHPIMPDSQYPSAPYPEPADTYPTSVNVEATNVPPVPSQKRKIEVARPGPIKKITDNAPTIPKPVETSTLPTGSFCNRCGSRVPPGSAFCNKCGTPVVTDAELDARAATINEPPVPTVPQVQIHTPPAYVPSEKKDRPIEDVIHSIEPLIEDSVPRTAPAPVIPNSHPIPATTAPETPPPDATVVPNDPQAPGNTDIPGVAWPVITPPEGTTAPASSDAPQTNVPPVPPQPPVPAVPPAPARSRKPLIIGAVVAVILIIVAAIVLLPTLTGGSGTTSPATEVITPATTTAVTTQVTAAPAKTAATTKTPEAAVTTAAATTTSESQSPVPDTGVWVRIVYANTFKGSVGTPGDQVEVYDTGDKIYQIPTSEGIVSVSVQKMDGSSEKLLVEVYKNGKIVAQKSSTVPKGVVEVLADLKPTATPTPTPTPTKIPIPVKTTASVNATANASATTAFA